jgi:pimeloyl-ACP methyl ester carboxylesterase
MQDVDQIQANALTAVQKPIAAACLGGVTGVPAWKSIPSWYLVSANDRMINPDAERFMAQRMNATTQEIPSSHASPVSHPYEVFKIIQAASQSIER